jgi:hypothetical protein
LGIVLLWSGPSSGPPRPAPIHLAQDADSVKLILTEVLFAPANRDTTFVELANVGRATVDLADFVLRIDTLDIPLPRLGTPVARGTRVLVRFDGRGTIESNIVHEGTATGLRAEGGSVALLSYDGRVLDRIAWGTAPGAILPPRGGLAPGAVEPGSSFGRPPGAERAGAPTEWVVYPPGQVTPGQANPLPPVVQLLPMDGAILSTTTVQLNWYPVPGAARYRVQLARDTTFAEPLLNQVVDRPSVSSGPRAAGVYWWRVQAIPAEGSPAAWSYPSRLELEGSRGDGDGPGAFGFGALGGAAEVRPSAPVLLNVPNLVQHKDSRMILLESQQSGGPRTVGLRPPPPHTWDADHVTLDMADPADNMNCAIASMTMLNNFYGGDLVQDRISYEMFSKNIDKYAGAIRARAIQVPTTVPLEKAPGPERDLNYGYGLSAEHIVAAGLYALGAAPGPGSGFASVDDVWTAAMREIDAGRPLIGVNCCHAFVIRGYEQRGGRRLLYLNDPWSGPGMPGQYTIDLDMSTRRLDHVMGYFSFPTHPAVARLEPTFSMDTDSDGVTNFDEINRFKTNPNDKDSDADGVPDKKDIESGVYELEHRYGYAWNPGYGNPGRDLDADGKPTELDPDSDDGGCKDGEEDRDKDGYHAAPETGNFDRTDDECGNLQGNLSWTEDIYNTDPTQIVKRSHVQGSIMVKLKPESPGSDIYVDDGSTFAVSGYARIEINGGPGCILYGRSHHVATGRFTNPGDIGGGRGDDSTLAFGAKADDLPGRAAAGGCKIPWAGGALSHSMTFPDCTGRLSPRSAPGFSTYRFNCNERNTVPGGLVTHVVAHGFIRVVKASP